MTRMSFFLVVLVAASMGCSVQRHVVVMRPQEVEQAQFVVTVPLEADRQERAARPSREPDQLLLEVLTQTLVQGSLQVLLAKESAGPAAEGLARGSALLATHELLKQLR